MVEGLLKKLKDNPDLALLDEAELLALQDATTQALASGEQKELSLLLETTLELRAHIANRLWKTSEPLIGTAIVKGESKEGTLSAENVNERIESLADEIVDKFPGEDVVLVTVLDGGSHVAHKLSEALQARKYKFEPASIRANSYGDGTASDEVQISAEPKPCLRGRTVILVDDVCDTGKTAVAIIEQLRKKKPKSIQFMALVDKPQSRSELKIKDFTPDFIGFTVPANAFICGVGLDLMGYSRYEKEIRAVTGSAKPTAVEWALLKSIALLDKKLQTFEVAEVVTDKPELKVVPKPLAPNKTNAKKIANNPGLSGISMQVLGGFMAALGAAAIAVAFVALNAATFGAVGLVVAGIGLTSLLAGTGFFGAGKERRRSVEPEPAQTFACG